ncbi:MAG: AtpZ/AtpI family protein [Candidatus Dojkabacteria bacterium]|nr:AtpZ/AtpI family protein [Candidatus Dojkabacteria bacterium]MDQ7020941.1 AtpZ/AtpI family protein [Candidatus Dojkabacteria bacterium]
MSLKNKTTETEEERIKRMKSQSYKLFFRVSLIVVVPAMLSTLIGYLIDRKFDIKPYGTLGSLLFFYIVTWVVLALFLKKSVFKNNE